MSAPPPKASQGQSSEEYVPTSVLDRFDKIETTQLTISSRVKLLQDANGLIIVVLFVAFIAMLFSAIFFFIQTINSDTNSRNELNKSVQEMNTKLEVQNSKSAPVN